ncbi:MAG: hypothetical protein JO093_08270 [Acidobacteria bacterium]|nr:hypothetical protein [Acidobacteriota bacterium]MBV9185603.1 hypothetical protein [Acidobacteriota bacterium]
MSRHLARFAVVLLLTSAPLFAQLTIGSAFSGAPNASDLNVAAVRTDIDLTAPASGTGTVTSAHIYWSQSGCSTAIKIKFFRRSGNTLTMTAERGPFSSVGADNTFAMSPAVSVQQGDLIGVARVAACGNPGTFFGFTSAGHVEFPSDVTGSVDLSTGVTGAPLALSGSGPAATEQVRGYIPVVGSTAGGLGSNFKTSMQLLFGAPTSTGSITGRLVFHPAGASGSSSDPSLSYTVAAGQVVTFPDVVAAFGRSGLGSVDLIAAPSATKPVIITRVFNDAGALGSAGLTEEVIDPSDPRVIQAGFTGFLVTPVDPTKTRFNIGVRTFFSGATITAVLRDTNGTALKTVSKTYLPNFFEQVDSTTFFAGTVIGPNQSISITVGGGGAVVYGATTDNITNDPNIQFAVALFGIA